MVGSGHDLPNDSRTETARGRTKRCLRRTTTEVGPKALVQKFRRLASYRSLTENPLAGVVKIVSSPAIVPEIRLLLFPSESSRRAMSCAAPGLVYESPRQRRYSRYPAPDFSTDWMLLGRPVQPEDSTPFPLRYVYALRRTVACARRTD